MFGLFKRRRQEATITPSRHVWEALSAVSVGASHEADAQTYFGYARPELVELIEGTPHFVLDVGCASGMLGGSVKEMFPQAQVWGIELDPAAAERAARRLDRALCADLERIDFKSAGVPDATFDLVFLADVLEHLYDPWDMLRRIKTLVKPGAQITASLPNVRNYKLLQDALLDGKFEYAEAGLLDVTHIRFFTKRSAIALFEETGYRVERVVSKYGGDVPIPPVDDARGRVDVELPRVTLRGLTPGDVDELRTYQFLISARAL